MMKARIPSAIWSFVLLLLGLLLSNHALMAQQIYGYNPGNPVPVYSSATCLASDIQGAINAINPNGEVRFANSICTISGSTVTVNKDLRFTAGAGATRLIIGTAASSKLLISSGATVTMDQANSLDIEIDDNGTLEIDANATLSITALGMTVALVNANATFLNNGTFATSGKLRTAGATDVLGANIYSTVDAPPGVYYNTATANLTGRGQFGNLFVMADWSPNSADGNYLTGSTSAAGNTTTIALAVGDGARVGIGQYLLYATGNQLVRITGVSGDVVTVSPALAASSAAGVTYEVVGFRMRTGAEMVVSTVTLTLNATDPFALAAASGSYGDFDVHFKAGSNLVGTTALSTLVSEGDTYLAGGASLNVASPLWVRQNLSFVAGATYAGGANQFFSSVTVEGNLDVKDTSIGATSIATVPVTVYGASANVEDASFDANLILSNLDASTTVVTTLTLGGTTASFTLPQLTVTPFATGSDKNASLNVGTLARTITTLTLNGTVSRRGILSTNGSGSLTVTTLNGVDGRWNNSTASSTVVNAATVNASGIVENTTGALGFSSTLTNNGTVRRLAGTFLVTGLFTNGTAGQIEAATGAGSLANALAAVVDVNYPSGIVNASATDGLLANGGFTNNRTTTAYSGNVIVAAGQTITAGAGALFGSLNLKGLDASAAVTWAGNLDVYGALVIRSGVLDLLTKTLTLRGTTDAANGAPQGGLYMGINATWTSNGMIYNVLTPLTRSAFGQTTAALVNGQLQVLGGQVQLVSDVWVSNATLAAGTTIKRELNASCFAINASASISGDGVVLSCGVFTISSTLGGSIRAQLIAAGYNPDAVNVSVEINIPASQTIALTDQGAEGIALNGANWKGVTISNTQRNFILRRGIVDLNNANLNLFGGFVFSGNGIDGSKIISTFTSDVSRSKEDENLSANGYVVFANNTIGGSVPQSNFKFDLDGINNGADDFTIDRLKINRTINNQVNINDGNFISGAPSTLVIRERFEVLNESVVNINDNNIKYIGGTPTTASLANTTAAERRAYRRVTLQSNGIQGTGYLDLANNYLNETDYNTINVNAVLTSGSFVLKTQFRQTGTVGQRDLVTTTGQQPVNTLSRISAFGNTGISYVSAGSINLNSVKNINDVDFFIFGNSRVVGDGITFANNLTIAKNDAGLTASYARVELTGANIVRGYLITNNSGLSGSSTLRVNGIYLSAGAGLSVEGNVTFKVSTPFSVARPARFTVGGTATTSALITLPTSTNQYIQRFQLNRPGGASFAAGVGVLQVNDLLLTNGTLTTDGRLSMRDLSNLVPELDGDADPNFATSSAGGTGFEALSNLSIVTRDRTASGHGQLSRGNGSFGAYSSFTYSSTTPGAPYTVQQIGSTGRFSGDELPGLALVNVKGNALNSVVNRLVIDLSTGTEFELSKDLVVKNRLETLSGTLDIAASAFLDIDGDMQWVHGHIVLQDIGSGVVRYPNTSGNAGASSGSTAKYDLFYVSNRNVTSDFEFQTGPGVRDLTIIPNGGTKSAPIIHTLSENKELSGSLRVVDGTFNLNGKTLKVEGNVIVDGKHNANDALMSVNANGNARVAGWFPVRHSAEASLNPYNYGVGTYDDGHGKINDATGILEFVGTGNSYLLGYVQKSTTRNTRLEVPVCSSTSMDSYCVSLPNIVVTKTATVNATTGTSNGRLVFEIDQIFKDDPDNQPNAYIIRSFKQNSGVTHLRPGATPQGNFPVGLNQSDAIASGAHSLEKSSAVTDYFGTGFMAKRTQYWVVRENMDLLKGSFFSWGATMTVGGNYTQGSVPAVQATFFGGQIGSPVNGAHPYMAGDQCYAGEVMKSADINEASGMGNSIYGCTHLRMQVLGNFAVLPDYTATATAAATEVLADVHRFYLANGWLGLAGNYSFFGHADETSGVDVMNANLGFVGEIEFNRPATAASLQTAVMVQSYRGYFQNLAINGRGVALAGSDTDHLWVNEEGILTLRLGNVVTNATGNAPNRKLILLNPSVDCWGPIPGICPTDGVTKTVSLDGLNVGSTITSGTIALSGSNSFVEGRLRRRTSDFSYTTGGFVQWGYIFPMGETFSDEYRSGTALNSATLPYYRNWQPLTIQNVFNQGTNNWIEVVSRTTTPAEDFTSFTVKGRRSGGSGSSAEYFDINLNNTSATAWNVIFEGVPAVEPNVRIGIQGLITNPQAIIDDMRIVAKQTGKPWRLAGEYDLTSDGPDDTYNPNDWVDGIPQFIQEGTGQLSQATNLAEVTYRLATDGIANPFGGSGEVARMQVIHNSPAGTVDVFVNGVRLLNDFTYQSATPFVPVVAGTPLTIDIKTSDGATTLLTINSAGLTDDKNYILIAQGGANGKPFEVKVVENARLVSTVSQALQLIFSHGVTNGPAVNLERVSTSTPRVMEQLLAVNAPFGSVTGYNTYTSPGITTFQLKASGSVVGQYLFTGLGEYIGEAITLLATGVVGGTGTNAMKLIGFDSDGTLIQGQITTSEVVDQAELPSTFALHGNFPNPFNPTTNIRFDLPEQARVRVEIVDVVGRTVMNLAPQTMSAGANKVISVDAARLSSGMYFYRVIAEGAERTYVQGSKFTLLK